MGLTSCLMLDILGQAIEPNLGPRARQRSSVPKLGRQRRLGFFLGHLPGVLDHQQPDDIHLVDRSEQLVAVQHRQAITSWSSISVAASSTSVSAVMLRDWSHEIAGGGGSACWISASSLWLPTGKLKPSSEK